MAGNAAEACFLPANMNCSISAPGGKLERFGPVILDRPVPAAYGHEFQSPILWRSAHAQFELGNPEQSATARGKWVLLDRLSEPWRISHGKEQFDLKLTEFGHVGVFPEQAANWDWVAAECHRLRLAEIRVLNLFAYTGGSTLAAASAGAAVTHVDAAQTSSAGRVEMPNFPAFRMLPCDGLSMML